MSGTTPQDPAAQAVIAAYNQVIGRDPTASELATGVQQVQAGVPIANIRAYLATTGYAADAVRTIYQKALGRAVTAPELASDLGNLAAGGSLGGLLNYLATSSEAGHALIVKVYDAVLHRLPTSAEVVASEAQLKASYSIDGLRYILATSPAGVAAVQSVYQDVAGRAPTAGELINAEAAIGTGATTLNALRGYFATTAEAAGKLQALYQTELGRAITQPELAADELAISMNSSLAGIRSYLAISTEGATALLRQYQATYGAAAPADALGKAQQALAAGASLQAAVAANPPTGTAPVSTADAISLLTLYQKLADQFQAEAGAAPAAPMSAADLGASEQALASGASLQTAVLSNPDGQKLIAAAWTELMGTAPSAGDVAAVAQAFGGTTPDVDGLHKALILAAGNSATFTNAINGALQAAIGRPANAVELAAYRSELDVGYPSVFGAAPDERPGLPGPTLPALVGEIAQLAAGPSASYPRLATAPITPQTVAGVPGYVYGLYQNDALITPSATAQVGFGYVGTFNPATDILQIEKEQVASFGALTLVQTNMQTSFGQNGSQVLFTTVQLGGGASIELLNVQKADLTAFNFRFV